MDRPILAATDLGVRGDNAAYRAARLAGELGVPLEVMYAGGTDLPERVAQPLLDICGKELRALTEQLAEHAKGNVKCKVRPEPTSEAIVREANDIDAGLLALGSRRQSGFHDLFEGSTLQAVALHTEVPLLVARHGAERKWRRVVVGADFSPQSRDALEIALRLCPTAKIEVLHVVLAKGSPLRPDLITRIEAARSHMKLFLSGVEVNGGRVTSRVVRQQRRDTVTSLLEEDGPDLIAVGSHSRIFIQERVLGSHAFSLLSEGTSDVLVVPPAFGGTGRDKYPFGYMQ